MPLDDLPVLIVRLDRSLEIPSYTHPGDAGADLYARVGVSIPPLGRCVVPTGIAVAIPDGYVGLIHPRSGLAAKQGLTVLNSPGTVDAGYRGEIAVTLVNTDPAAEVAVARGDRIAQIVFAPVERARFIEVEQLPGSARDISGFGSTGG